ncbi:MAG: hypothetical protein ACYS7M_15460 [Planctomycetota bacterium]
MKSPRIRCVPGGFHRILVAGLPIVAVRTASSDVPREVKGTNNPPLPGGNAETQYDALDVPDE